MRQVQPIKSPTKHRMFVHAVILDRVGDQLFRLAGIGSDYRTIRHNVRYAAAEKDVDVILLVYFVEDHHLDLLLRLQGGNVAVLESRKDHSYVEVLTMSGNLEEIEKL